MPQNFWETLPLGEGVKMLASDENGVAALNKPAGTLSHPNTAHDAKRSLLAAAYDTEAEYYHWPQPAGGEGKLWLLNRLDSIASGAILVAASETLAREVRAQFTKRTVHKIYNALVFGKPAATSQVWRDWLSVRKSGDTIRTRTGGHVSAESLCSPIRFWSKPVQLALVRLEPRTGRSHQLRVQCSRRGLPIVGDQTYGDFLANRQFAKHTSMKRLFLHSLETRFGYTFAGNSFTFKAVAPLPPEFTKFL